MGELSGVARLPDGTFVFANDETRSAIFLWDGNPEHAPRRQSFDLVLDDLEGVAADSSGNLYLLTSHSPTRRGRVRPERGRLARLAPVSAAMAYDPPTAMKIDVVEDLTAIGLDLFGANRSQVNLEGLAWYPHGDRLLIGARSPLREGNAQLLAIGPVTRLFDPARPQGAAEGLDLDLHVLDLGGRGIRSLAFDSWRDEVWVLAGPAGGGKDFAFFLWTPGGATVEPVEAPELYRIAKPEGIEIMGRADPVTGKIPVLVAAEGAEPVRLMARPPTVRQHPDKPLLRPRDNSREER